MKHGPKIDPVKSLPYGVASCIVIPVKRICLLTLWKEINRMHSSQIIENVAHDLVEGGTYSALTIQHAIDSLNRALIELRKEETIALIWEGSN
jgi:hypothetical protein